MPEIASWLARLGLAKYIDVFQQNEIDLDALQQLTYDDLKELGLPLGPRRKILAAIGTAGDRQAMQAASLGRRREAERRQLTVMFVDLVGSTELSQRCDPEEMRDLIGAYHGAVSREIAGFEGHVAKLMGDGVLAYFGWPCAHEDDAERAVRAGLATVGAVARLVAPGGDLLSARVGIATGLVVVGDLVGEGSAQEEAVVGEAPNLAARLLSLGDPSGVVVADNTRRLVDGLFEVVDLGRQQLKGFASAQRAWRIAGDTPVESRFHARRGSFTPMVGRRRELEALLQRWRQARSGEGHTVLLSGEPGIGKSRLVAALESRLGAEPHAVQRYFCSAYHVNSSLHPVIRQLEQAIGINREDSSEVKLDKLEALLTQFSSNLTETLPLLGELLSISTAGRYQPLNLSAQGRKLRTSGALADLLNELATRQPVLMVVEDAHWIDPSSSEWLGAVIDRVVELPVLLVISFRPEFQPPWKLSAHTTALSLGRLGRNAGVAIIDRLATGITLPPDVREHILAKTEGVPLFVEELTKSVIESGSAWDGSERSLKSGSSASIAVPSTLQDSLMARLDRLGSAKELAQAGACVGRAFHHRLLAAVAGFNSARLERGLQQLENSELVFRSGDPPEAIYTFKHALVQDTAYQSLLKSRRQKVHAAIAAALETEFPAIASTEPETLAYHHTAAGSAKQAITYWLKAGQAAVKRSANQEAIVHLSKGIEIISSLPDSEERLRQEIQLNTSLGVALMAAKGWGAPDVLQAFSKARVLSERLNDNGQLFIALCGEASYHMISGNLRAADELGTQCVEIAESDGAEALLLEADHRQWATKFFKGDYAAAEQHIDRGMAIYDPDRHHSLTYIYTGHDPGVCGRSYSSRMLWLRGYPDQAVERGREAVALAERVSHPFSVVLAEQTLSEVLLIRREPAEARPVIEKWGRSSKELVLSLMTSQVQFQLGWALAQEGRANEGLQGMREGIAAIAATGAAMGMQYFLCVLAQACCGCGHVREGLSVLERALKIVADTGALYQLPEILRTKAELLLRMESPEESPEACFHKAIGLARNEGTKSLELRAALSLARLYRSQHRDAEAWDVLSPVYSWFTEGHDTPDLVEAKTLLEQLH